MWGTPTGLSLSRSTIADSMKTLGYDTHLVGKWHVGDCNEAYSPLNRGFDTFYGIHGAMGDYVYKVEKFMLFSRQLSAYCTLIHIVSINLFSYFSDRSWHNPRLVGY